MTDMDLERFAPAVDLPIDPGIRRAVLLLRSEGVETFESCQGGTGHSCPEPIIRFKGCAGDARDALAAALRHQLPVLQLRYTFSVIAGEVESPCWELSFWVMPPTEIR
jgi:hypothetical protein